MHVAVAARIVNHGFASMEGAYPGSPLVTALGGWAVRTRTNRWPLAEALSAVEPIARSLANERHHFYISPVLETWVASDSVCLEQAVLLAMLAVCEAMPEGGRVRVDTFGPTDGTVSVMFVGTGSSRPVVLPPRTHLLTAAATAARGRYVPTPWDDGRNCVRLDFELAADA